MAFTDWSSTPILNADVPGASFHDLPQTSGVWAVGIRQIMADLVTASAGWGGSGGQLNTTYANWYTTRSTSLGTPGNYSPQAGVSPLLNRIPAGMAWGPFDMYGTAIDNTGLGAAGAYQ